MPVAFTIDLPRRLVLSRAWALVTDADLLVHASTLGADPRFEPTFRQLIDFTAVTDISVSTTTIHQMARLSPFRPGARRVLVAGSDVIYGMARMFQMLREPVADEIHIVRSILPALEWLELADVSTEILTLLAAAPRSVGTWLAPLANDRVSIVWAYRLQGDLMTGTLTSRTDHRLMRHVVAVLDSV